MRILALSLLSSCILAQQSNSTKPTVTAEQRAAFWRAVANINIAKAAMEKSQATLSSLQSDMEKTCGESYTLQLDQSGEPTCVEKPKVEVSTDNKHKH